MGSPNDNGETALYLAAANVDASTAAALVKMLIVHDNSLQVTSSRMSPLRAAVKSGALDAINLLLECKFRQITVRCMYV